MPDDTTAPSQAQSHFLISDQPFQNSVRGSNALRGEYVWKLMFRGAFASMHPSEQATYLGLCAFISCGNLTQDGLPFVWPSYAELQRLTGFGRASVFRALDALQRRGVIRKVGDGGGRVTTRWELLPIDEHGGKFDASQAQEAQHVVPTPPVSPVRRVPSHPARATRLTHETGAVSPSARHPSHPRDCTSIKGFNKKKDLQKEAAAPRAVSPVRRVPEPQDEVLRLLLSEGLKEKAAKRYAMEAWNTPEAVAVKIAKYKKKGNGLGYLCALLEADDVTPPAPSPEERHAAASKQARESTDAQIAKRKAEQAAELERTEREQARMRDAMQELSREELSALFDAVVTDERFSVFAPKWMKLKGNPFASQTLIQAMYAALRHRQPAAAAH